MNLYCVRAAKLGNAQAQYELGGLYDNGKEVLQDKEAALKLYTEAAEQGVVEAQYKLGWMYRDGEGVPQDYAAALKWFTHAAGRGFNPAQHDLGWMYCRGLGVPQDLVRGAMWLNITGLSVECCSFAKDMTPAEIKEAKKLADDWEKKYRSMK